MGYHKHFPVDSQDRTKIICAKCRKILTPSYMKARRKRIAKAAMAVSHALHDVVVEAGNILPSEDIRDIKESAEQMEHIAKWLKEI